MFLAIAILFTLLQLTIAFFLVVFSVHGPSSLPALALAWIILMQIILWTCFVIYGKNKNKNAAIYMIFLAFISTATGPLMFFIAEKYDSYIYDNRL